jgi:hypothetical protein
MANEESRELTDIEIRLKELEDKVKQLIEGASQVHEVVSKMHQDLLPHAPPICKQYSPTTGRKRRATRRKSSQEEK